MTKECWDKEPVEKDFSNARTYLSLLMDSRDANRLIKSLKESTDIVRFEANDILRASGLALLPKDDAVVAKNLKLVKSGKRISPILLIRGTPLLIADGYHRVCASYHLDEVAEIPCRITSRGTDSNRGDGER